MLHGRNCVYEEPSQVILRHPVSLAKWGCEHLDARTGLAAEPWPEPINLPLLYATKPEPLTSDYTFSHPNTVELLLFILHSGSWWQMRKPQVKECRWLRGKHRYWTHSLSHHAFFFDQPRGFSLCWGDSPKRIRSVGNRFKVPGVKLLPDH